MGRKFVFLSRRARARRGHCFVRLLIREQSLAQNQGGFRSLDLILFLSGAPKSLLDLAQSHFPD